MMHADEAVQAYRAAELWQGRGVRYDPADLHGLTLPYLTLPALALGPARDWAGTREWQYRLAPALAGVGTVAAFALLADGLGAGAWAAAALAALSPAAVFYDRSDLHEPLLVLFLLLTVACGWRWSRTRRAGWLWAAGLAGGLALATKETVVLAAASLAAAALLLRVRVPWRRLAGPAAAGLAAAALVQTSVLAHHAGIADALRAPFVQAARGLGGGEHAHPWSFYLGILAGEGPLAGLAVIGAAAGGLLPRFFGLSGAVLLALSSALPYKTPWCALGVLTALAVPAGAGAAALIASRRRRWLALPLLAALVHLGGRAAEWGVAHADDPRNPYAYAATSRDVLRLADLVGRLAAAHRDGEALPVAVTTRDCWPLPWLLRRYPKVGYWDAVPHGPPAPVVISKAGEGGDAGPRGRYVASHFGLRRGVVLTVHAEEGLWNRMARGAGAR